MGVSEPRRLLTAEEFAMLPDNGMKQELIHGEVVEMPPASHAHGRVVLRIMARVEVWATEHGLGEAAANGPGFITERGPDVVRAPDGAFFTAQHAPGPDADRYLDQVPDLVLEVVSKSDRTGDVLTKAGQWRSAGVQVVWVVWPATERVMILGPGEEVALLGRGDTLTCESLLPGLALPLDVVFGPAGQA